MLALVTFVEPEPREITVTVPSTAARRATDERRAPRPNLFLAMLAAERGAAKNTLDAYRRDLDDYLAYLQRSRLDARQG